jgi:hypothetical protein
MIGLEQGLAVGDVGHHRHHPLFPSDGQQSLDLCGDLVLAQPALRATEQLVDGWWPAALYSAFSDMSSRLIRNFALEAGPAANAFSFAAFC